MQFKSYLMIFCSFFIVELYGQDVRPTLSAKIDISKQIKVVTQHLDYNTYRVNDYINKNSKEIQAHPKFFIDIPKKLSFTCYNYRGKVGTYVFSDSLRCIVIEIHYQVDPRARGEELYLGRYSSDESSIINKLLMCKENGIEDGLYYGLFTKGSFLTYYYNIDRTEIDMFNISIQSIRKKK